MAMSPMGAVRVSVYKAPYTLPSYALLNAAGYGFQRFPLGAKLNTEARYTAGYLSSFAAISLQPSGYAETVLNPNTTAGTDSAINGVTDFDVSEYAWSYYGPHSLHTVNTPRTVGSYVAADVDRYVPPGDNTVLYPEVNLRSACFSFTRSPAQYGYEIAAKLWIGSYLYHGSSFYMMTFDGVGSFSFLNAFEYSSTSVFDTETSQTCFRSDSGVVYMVQIRDGGVYGPSRLWAFEPTTYNAEIPCPSPLFIKTLSFGNTAMDTALSTPSNVSVSAWKHGFVFRLHTFGAGPTGAQYEFAVTDMNCNRFYLLQFEAIDTATKNAFAVGTPEIKIDRDGNIFWINGTIANKNDVFLSGALVQFDWPIFQVGHIPPLSLPCFNPCLPTERL